MEDTGGGAESVKGGEGVTKVANGRTAGIAEEVGEVVVCEAARGTAEGVEGGDRPAYVTQYYAATAATMGALALGTVLGYSSPAGPLLLAGEDGWLPLTQQQYSWFSSSSNLGAAGGGLVGGLCATSLGRRPAMMASATVFLCGWLMIALANNFGILLCGRLLTGVSMGISSSAAPTYIGEMASPKIRGTLGSLFQVMLTGGIVFAFVAGAVLDTWRWIAVACTVPSLLYFLLVFFATESPAFLMAKGKYKQAEESLQYFRGHPYNIQPELRQMRQAQEEASIRKISLGDLRSPYILKPLVISLTLMLFQQFSGLPAVSFNLSTIFKESGSGLSENLSAVIVALMRMLATCGATALIDRVGRRPLLIFSSATMALSIVCLGLYFYVRERHPAWVTAELSRMPLVFLIVFTVAFSVGFGPVPWVMMGEFFDPRVRDAAASLVAAVSWTSGFITTLIFIPLQNSLGVYGVYWFFGGINIAALVFSALLVPETKGKTLQEITMDFGGPSVSSSSNKKIVAAEE